jgi:hypothetical protein
VSVVGVNDDGTDDEADDETATDGGTGAVGDDAPFTRCEDCGSIRVSGSAHSCDAGSGTSSGRTRAERERLIEADDGDPSDDVFFLRGRTDSAYHEPRLVFDLDAMLVFERTPPRCRSEPEKRDYDRGTREYAQRTGRFPCSYCYPDAHE